MDKHTVIKGGYDYQPTVTESKPVKCEGDEYDNR